MAASLLLSSVFLATAQAAHSGLAMTPQMGWNTWNAFGCSTSQDLLLSTATTIKKIGLQDAGYHYIVQDDCWSAGRDSSGALKWDTGKFPSGIPYVATQLHNQGFGFGIYSDAGTATCAGYAASLGHEAQDAKTWASWGVDYLKYDNCNNNGQAGSQSASSSRYSAMASALSSSGRAILYSICNWGQDSPWVWGPSMGNSWRISGDIRDNFNSATSACGVPNYGGYNCPVTSIIQQVTKIASSGAPGGWNDMDMLEIGNGGMSDSEYVVHFSMWAAAKSPLIMGNAMSKLTAADYSILANAPVIAVSQDPLGIPATQKWANGNTQLWSGQLASTTGGTKDQLVVLLNLGSSAATVTASLSDIFGGSPPASQWEIRDLWGSRLSDSQSQTILSNGASASSSLLYNSTATSYATGLSQANPKLLGTSIGSAQTGGSISESVPGLGCRVLRLRATSQSGSTGMTTSTVAPPTTTSSNPTTTSSTGSTAAHYGQCGGSGWTGPTQCQSPYTCQVSNPYYSQCL